MIVWTLAEIRDGKIHPVSFELLAWGRTLADELGVNLVSVVLGYELKWLDELFFHGADMVYLADEEQLSTFKVDSYAKVLSEMVAKYKPQIFIASATTQGRSIMPVLYADLGCGLTADCTELSIEKGTGLLVQTRPAIGGNVMADIKTPEKRPQMCTVRPKSKRPLQRDAARTGEIVRFTPKAESLSSLLKVLGFERENSIGLPIQDAEVIVAGGKGMKGLKNWALLEELAALLGGSVGASRSAVDLGWAPYSAQVGLSGKSVTPKLYISCGISGAVQHIAGMSGAEKIVAINSDPEAPIFRIADLAVVGDASETLSLLIEALKGEVKK